MISVRSGAQSDGSAIQSATGQSVIWLKLLAKIRGTPWSSSTPARTSDFSKSLQNQLNDARKKKRQLRQCRGLACIETLPDSDHDYGSQRKMLWSGGKGLANGSFEGSEEPLGKAKSQIGVA